MSTDQLNQKRTNSNTNRGGGAGAGAGGSSHNNNSGGRGSGGGGQSNNQGRGGGGGGNRNNNHRRNQKKNVDKSNVQQHTNQQLHKNMKQESNTNTKPDATTNANASNKRNRNRNRNSNRKKNNNNTKQDTAATAAAAAAAAPKQPTEEEELQIKLEKEKHEQILLQQKLQAQKLAKEKQRQEELTNLESTISTKLSELNTIQQTTNKHLSNRTKLLNKDTLSSLRQSFQSTSSKKKLKSDFKKCTAFIKKIKSSSSQTSNSATSWWNQTNTIQSFVKDITTLNLTRYMDEIVNAFMECKFKIVDIPGVVDVCIELHTRYDEFMDLLLDKVLEVVKKKGSSDSSNGSCQKQGGGGQEDWKKQKRIYLRFLMELYVNGVMVDVKPIMKVLVEACGATPSSSSDGTTIGSNEKEVTSDGGSGKKFEYNVTNANMVVSFAKAATFELIGIVPKSIHHSIQFLESEVAKIEATEISISNNTSATNVGGSGEVEHEKKTDNTKEGECHEATVHDDLPTKTNNNHENDDRNCDLDKPVVASQTLLLETKQTLDQITQTTLQQRASTSETCAKFQKHLLGAYKSLSSTYIATHCKLSKLEKRCEQDRLLQGSLSESREKGLQDARSLMESLQKSVHALAEVLNVDVPILVEEEEDLKQDKSGVEIYKNQDGNNRDMKLGPFDDEETKAFYCDIPDLLTTIPPALLGYSPEDVEKQQEKNLQKYGDGGGIVDEESNTDKHTNTEEIEDLTAITQDGFDSDSLQDEGAGETETEDNDCNKDTPHYKLIVLLEQELPECNRIDKVNEVAEKFCTNHGTTKNARKRMQKSLFTVPRGRLDLLPYYARIAAIFDRVFPDIAEPLVLELEKQFHGLARFKKQQSLENRLQNARFIGELTKFRVAPPIVVLRGVRRCLDDFSGYNIDVLCCLLESCGRFMYRMKHTSNKITQLLETIQRIRKAKNLDERHIALLHSAFFMVQPPQTPKTRDSKLLSPLEAYLRDLLLFRLGTKEVTSTFCSKQLLRFPWSDVNLDCGALITKYLLKACRKGRYKSIQAVVAIIANLRKTKPELLTRVIDSILEELHYAMENPNFRDQQRSIIYAKLLGEMNSQGLVSGSLVIEQLYDFVNFNHDIPQALHDTSITDQNLLSGPMGISGTINEDEEMEEDDFEEKEEKQTQLPPVAVSKYSKYDPRVPSIVDPNTAVFRVKLICALLDRSVDSLVTSGSFSKIEKFMAAFQRYLFIKSNLPADVEFSILDSFDLVDSKMKLIKSDSKKKKSLQRFKTWMESQNFVVSSEEADALLDDRLRKRLLAQAGIEGIISESTDLDDTTLDDEYSLQSHENDSLDQNSLYSFGDDSGDSAALLSDEDTIDQGEVDEMDLDEDNDDESVEEEVSKEDYMRQLEDEAFERELRKLTMDALEKGKNSARTTASAKVSDSMPSASQFTQKKAIDVKTLNSDGIFTLGGEAGMAFKMIKRGHKGRVEAKEIVVPSDTNLAKIASKQDDEAAKERDILKARVLQYEAESANHAFSGDVYMDQERLPPVRNRLTMEDIDRNFGSSISFRRRDQQGGRGSRTRTLWRS